MNKLPNIKTLLEYLSQYAQNLQQKQTAVSEEITQFATFVRTLAVCCENGSSPTCQNLEETKQLSAVLPLGDDMRKYKNKTIKKRKDGRYWTRYYDSERKQHSVYGRTQAECLQNLKKALKLVATGNAPRKDFTLGEWLEKWLQMYKVGNVKETTVGKIQSLLKAVDPLKNRAIGKIGAMELQAFFNSIPYPRKREQVYICLKGAFTKAHKNHLIKENPFDVVEVAHAKQQRTSRSLTHAEEASFVEACKKSKYGGLYLMCLYQGLRLGEALALTVQDVDTEKMQLTVSKSLNGDNKLSTPKTESSNRTMPLFAKTRDILPEKAAGRLFDETTRKYYQKCMAEMCKELGLDGVSIHTLRHTFATRCSEAGIAPKVVQKWLGHSTLEMTLNVYTHVNKEFEQKETAKFDTYFDTCCG